MRDEKISEEEATELLLAAGAPGDPSRNSRMASQSNKQYGANTAEKNGAD